MSKDKSGKDDPFPLERARTPSWLAAEVGAFDLCVSTGHPDAPDFAELCVAFAAPTEDGG